MKNLFSLFFVFFFAVALSAQQYEPNYQIVHSEINDDYLEVAPATPGSFYSGIIVILDSVDYSTADTELRRLPVKRIADEAFMNSQVSAVSIPQTITTIGQDAFKGATKLKRILYLGDYNSFDNIDISSGWGFSVDEGRMLYVPKKYHQDFLTNATTYLLESFSGGIYPIAPGEVDVYLIQDFTSDLLSIDLSWFFVSNVVEYVISVFEDDVQTWQNTYNSVGQLIGNISFSPAAIHETTSTLGMGTAIFGPVKSGSKYKYNIQGKGEDDSLLYSCEGEFEIQSAGGMMSLSESHEDPVIVEPTVDAIESVSANETNTAKKILISGNTYILLPNGKLFMLNGSEVK